MPRAGTNHVTSVASGWLLRCAAKPVTVNAPFGVQLLPEAMWKDLPDLEILIDANATPPLGIQGIDLMHRATPKHGKLCYGAIGFGGFKLEVHRACVAKLFESNDQVLDALEIYALAKAMMAAR